MGRVRDLGDSNAWRASNLVINLLYPPYLSYHSRFLKTLSDSRYPRLANMVDELQPQGVCRLLKLPPELRNEIWRYAVVEDYGIAISVEPDGYYAPPLLRTCHEIRKDAGSIFYSENTFEFQIRDFDCAPFQRLGQFCAHYLTLEDGTFDSAAVTVTFLPYYEPNAENLKTWLREFCRLGHSDLGTWGVVRECRDGLLLLGRETVVFEIIGAMFDTIQALLLGDDGMHSEIPLSHIERVLEPQFALLESIDKRWEVVASQQER
jgi:hypothetical protein